MKSPRLLVCTRFSPLGQSGTATYLFGILRHLRSRGFRITICWSEQPAIVWRRGWWVVPREIAQTATLLLPGGICLGRLRLFPRALVGPWKKRLRAALKRALLALGLGPVLGLREPPSPGAPGTASLAELYPWNRPPDPYEEAFFGRALARLRPDAVLANYCWLDPVFRQAPPGAPCLKISLTYDLCHLYSTLVDGRIVQVEGQTLDRETETAYLREADLIVAIREDDAAAFRRLLPGKEVLTVHPSFPAAPCRRAPLPHRVLFVAADNEPNREGIAWFLREAWPQVRAAHPAAELHVCGTIGQRISPREPGVLVRGFVDSLQDVYEEAAVVIVPLLRGSGVKIKLMEALAHGKACVSTPIGVEGVPALDGCVCVAGRAGEFAAHVARLLSGAEARRALEERALATVATRFSPEACCGPLAARMLQTAR
ncbi:MAG: glycosyltransferase [Chthoniobacteraceae bacterium]|nr:glycosyltransferase [Chthoniobacteraceae bacterium]